jgi:hypothetical protein
MKDQSRALWSHKEIYPAGGRIWVHRCFELQSGILLLNSLKMAVSTAPTGQIASFERLLV